MMYLKLKECSLQTFSVLFPAAVYYREKADGTCLFIDAAQAATSGTMQDDQGPNTQVFEASQFSKSTQGRSVYCFKVIFVDGQIVDLIIYAGMKLQNGLTTSKIKKIICSPST